MKQIALPDISVAAIRYAAAELLGRNLIHRKVLLSNQSRKARVRGIPLIYEGEQLAEWLAPSNPVESRAGYNRSRRL
jgi:hypothetical protein